MVAAFFIGDSLFAQSPISGKVVDAKGMPIAGVSVFSKGVAKGTATDSAGAFAISTNPNGSLVFSAIGYADTVVNINNERSLTVTLHQRANTLSQVTVSASQAQQPVLSNEITNEHNIENTLEDYIQAEQLGAGIKTYSGNFEGGGSFHITTTAYMGALNTGSFMPVYHQPTETRGSRFIMNDWSPGLVVNQFDTVIKNDSYRYNFDKITGDLLMTQDGKQYIEIDRTNVKSFAIKGQDGGYVFEQVHLLDPTNYFMLLGKGGKYASYKAIKTKLVKANGGTNGLTSTGHDYDEYVDQFYYFLIDLQTNEIRQFEPRKKSIREVAGEDRPKVEKYISQHRYDNIDDKYITGLVNYLNS